MPPLNLTWNSSRSDYFLPLKLQVPCGLADGFYLLGDLGASKEGGKGPNGLCPEFLFSLEFQDSFSLGTLGLLKLPLHPCHIPW